MNGFTENDGKRLSAFQLMLEDYLIEEHPERMDDREFIQSRSREAEEAFTEASRQGHDVGQSMEKAMDILYRGLHFSPYKTVREIICDLLPEVDDEEKHRLTMQMMENQRRTLDSCESSADDFMATGECSVLTDRLRKGITAYLHENALVDDKT